MRNYKKIGAFLLSALLAASSVVPVQAANGPASSANNGCAYIYAEQNSVGGYEFNDASAEWEFSSPKHDFSGLDYDRSTNTLTMTDFVGTEISTNMMGDDFKIKLVGNNELKSMTFFGYGYGGSVTFCGDGTLTITGTSYYGQGISLQAEESSATLAVTEAATIHIVAPADNQDGDDYEAVLVFESNAKDKLNAQVIEGQREDIPIYCTDMGYYEEMGIYVPIILVKKGTDAGYCVVNLPGGGDASAIGTDKIVLCRFNSDNTITKLAEYANEAAMKAAGYQYITSGEPMVGVYGKTVTLVAKTNDNNPTTPGSDTGSLTEEGLIVVDGQTYRVKENGTGTKEGQEGTVSFVFPKDKEPVITIPATVTAGGVTYKVVEIENGAFAGNKTVEKIIVGENVEKIGSEVFKENPKLKEIEILTKELKAKEVKKDAFAEVGKEVSVTIPASVANDYKMILKNGGLDAKIPVVVAAPVVGDTLVSGGNTYIITASGVKNGVPGTVSFVAPKAGMADVIIPTSIVVDGITYKVTAIEENAFKGNENLTSVTIGSNVAVIGSGAFEACRNLKKIEIKSSNLTSKTVDKTAFVKCNSNVEIEVPLNKASEYTKILQTAGVDKKATVKESAPVAGDYFVCDGATYKVTKAGTADGTVGTVAFMEAKAGQKAVVVPDSVTVNGIIYNVVTIASNAFVSDAAATSVTVGKNIKYINSNAFGGCEKVTKIKIESRALTAANVKKNAFAGVSVKATVSVPVDLTESYQTILQGAALNKKITVKAYVPAKGEYFLFDGHKYKVTTAGTAKKNGAVAFVAPKKGSKKVVIPATVKIGGITYKVTAISQNAFANNKTVTDVTIGKNVKYIYKKAFYKCSKITKLTVNTKLLTTKTVKKYAFSSINSKVVITVPKGMQKTYETVLKGGSLSTKITVKEAKK